MKKVWSYTYPVKLGDSTFVNGSEAGCFEKPRLHLVDFSTGLLVECLWRAGIRYADLHGAGKELEGGMTAAFTVRHYGQLLHTYIEYTLPKDHPNPKPLDILRVKPGVYELPVGEELLRFSLEEWRGKIVRSRKSRSKDITVSCPTQATLALLRQN